MNWLDYENYITNHFRSQFPNTSIEHNVKEVGFISKAIRQIDILIKGKLAGFNMKLVIDCKYFNKKLNITHVDKFIGFCKDVKANKGILITNKGYSKSAYDRAYYDSDDIELRIIEFEKLKELQSFLAIPYSGNNAAVIPAPEGWIIDAKQNSQYLATLYPYGLDKKSAFLNDGFMYVSISNRDKQWPDMDHLINVQEVGIENHYSKYEIEYQKLEIRENERCILRVLKTDIPDTIEYTVFIEFNTCVLFITLITDYKHEKTYLKKMKWVIEKLKYATIIHR